MDFPPMISYHFYGSNGRILTVYDKNKVPNDKTPYIIKVMEDLTPKVCVITIQIANTEIFDVLISDDTRDENWTNKINFFTMAMLRLANKERR